MSQPTKHIAIFASGNGTNAEAIIHYFKNHWSVSISLIVSNNTNALVLQRAASHHIPSLVISRSQFSDPAYMLSELEAHNITHIVLAGFLWLIPSYLIQAFSSRIINIHPSLLPKYGGKGMYGNHVHEAVKKAQEKETGITIHEVNERFDDGKIISQQAISILPTDTSSDIARRVHTLEYQHFAPTIELWVNSSTSI